VTPRRVRCSKCDELTDPAELSRVGRDRYCQSCLPEVALAEDEAQELPRLPRKVWAERVEIAGWPVCAFSASQFSRVFACPESWRRRYGLGVREPSRASQLAGQAVHAAIQRALIHDPDASPATLKKAAEEEFALLLAKAPLEGLLALDLEGVSLTEWSERAGTCAYGFALDALPSQPLIVNAASIEHQFQWFVPGVPIPVTGFIDAMYDRGGLLTLPDYKTGGSAQTTPRRGWLPQAWIYGAALGVEAVEFCSGSWAGNWKRGGELVVPITRASDARARAYVRGAWRILSGLMREPGVHAAWPGNPGHSYQCNGCAGEGICDYTRVDAPVLALDLI
jgi:hypothetical protein